MQIVSVIVSLSVSIVLVLWIVKLKKDKPFPKGSVAKMLAFGALSAIVVGIITIVVALGAAVWSIGPDTAMHILSLPDAERPAALQEVVGKLNINASAPSVLRVFLKTFFTIGLVEELAKYFFAWISLRKKDVAKNWLDVVLVCALVGLGFQMMEDFTYASGNMISAIFRAVTPFHFVFGACMGYFLGKAKVESKPAYVAAAILVPTLAHSLFDTGVNLASYKEYEVLALMLVLAMALVLLAAFVVELVLINKWHKAGTPKLP